MRIYLIPIACIAAILPGAAMADDWRVVSKTNADKSVYVDYESITRDGDAVLVSVRWDWTDDPSADGVIEIDRMIYDCKASTFSLRWYKFYDRDGKVTKSGEAPPGFPMKPIQPRTISREIADMMCGTAA